MQKITDKFADHLNLCKELKGELKMLVDLHDIGEITIPKKIIIKKDKLNNDEWELIKKHPEKGAAIVNSTDSYSHLSKYIKHHHEWWDGSGYPEGLKGKKIPFLSRIMLIIDAYDVMRSGRPYQKALTKNEALREIENNSARQFDPELTEEFIKIMENEELL